MYWKSISWIAAATVLVAGVAFAEDKPVSVAININALSTGTSQSAHQRLEDSTRTQLSDALAKLGGLDVVRSNSDLLLTVSVIQVDEDTFAFSSMSLAYSPACIGLVLFETGVFGKQSGLERVVEAIVSDFDVNTLIPYLKASPAD